MLEVKANKSRLIGSQVLFDQKTTLMGFDRVSTGPKMNVGFGKTYDVHLFRVHLE